MTEVSLSNIGRRDSSVACLLYNILNIFGIHSFPKPSSIANVLEREQWWGPAKLDRSEMGYGTREYVPMSVLGEETRFLLNYGGLHAYSINPYYPEGLEDGYNYLQPLCTFLIGREDGMETIWQDYPPEKLALWQLRARLQTRDYLEAGSRMRYDVREPEFEGIVAAVSNGAVARLPWSCSTWSSLPALAYTVNDDGHLMIHLPGFPQLEPFAFSQYDMSWQTWTPSRGATLYWRE